VGLQRANIRVGDRALLSYTDCLGFSEAFMGCLLAGVVPIPVAAPEPNNLDRTLSRLRTIAATSGATTILTAPSLITRMTELFFALHPRPEPGAQSPLSILATWGDAELCGPWQLPHPIADDIAFVQFTSGSTSDPKGVVITHANLAANQRILTQAMSLGPNCSFVSWLPVHHDMGLIGELLLAIWNGRPITLMLPHHFMERPARWLEAISGQQAVMSGAPNFAFAVVVRKLSDEVAAGLDLSGWQTAFCGSEPIRLDVMRRFIERLAPHGLRPQALVPCYGLAESTLFVCGTRPWTATPKPNDGSLLDNFVICGRPGPQIELAIVDPVLRTRCAAKQEGEVWLRGPNVGRGYWADPEQTARTFAAQITAGSTPGSTPEVERGAWLRTGDLGRMRAGALYITGRMKDLIIVNGRNIYPQDVELAIDGCHADVRPGCAAAFAVAGDGSEAVGVAFELREARGPANLLSEPSQCKQPSQPGQPSQRDQLIVEAACAAVARALDVQLMFVALLAPRTILKTTSGKPQRRATRVAIEDGTLAPLLVWRAARAPSVAGPTADDVVVAIAAWISAHTGRVLAPDIAHAGLDELGVDSIAKAELLDWIHQRFARRITMDQLLAQASIAALAALIRGDAGLAPDRETAALEAASTRGSATFLPPLSWLRKT
jgi:acyl-CoA synthetase (AMP-forming)/AMP-acid ligase II/acyl carrier protein